MESRYIIKKRASGPEELPAEFLKNGTLKLIAYLEYIPTRYVNGKTIPTSWKEAWITPIHKKGRKDDCANYRCISVISTMSRPNNNFQKRQLVWYEHLERMSKEQLPKFINGHHQNKEKEEDLKT